MSEVSRPDSEPLSPTRARRVDQVCNQFESAWRGASRPRIEDFVGAAGEMECSSLLRELLVLELQYRFRNGESPTLEEYQLRFPQDVELVAAVYREAASGGLLSSQPDVGPDTTPNTQPYRPSGSPLQAGEIGDPPLQFIGKYRIVEKLGAGGQAEVFRAVHPVLRGRDVVIKLAQQRLPEEQQQQLLREGQALARLEDVGLARVYDVDVHETRPFLVMEYIAGRSLRDQLKERRPASREAAALVAQLARTLAKVHGEGVLHRDLKPANIFLDATGRPRILDFGLALMAQPWSEARSPEGEVSGTFQYMAPEQAEGQSYRIGPRTDVFGLGAVLYELLTGRPPYQAATRAEVWEQARQAKVVPPRALNPRAPRALERICLKALAADPNERYATAAELERALRGYLRRPRLVGIGLGLVGLGVAVLLLVAFSPPGGSIEPNLPVGGDTLSAELILRVWTRGEGKSGLRVGEDPAALPVRNGELVHLEARLNQPAYVYLIWIDSEGNVASLYPWEERSFLGLPAAQAPVEQLHSPPEWDKGWPIVGPSGLETAMLLVRRTPLSADATLSEILGKLKPSRLRHIHEVAVRGFDPGQPTDFLDMGQNRGLGTEAAEVDEPLVQLLERLRPHFELIRAVRFAHQGE